MLRSHCAKDTMLRENFRSDERVITKRHILEQRAAQREAEQLAQLEMASAAPGVVTGVSARLIISRTSWCSSLEASPG